MRGPLGMQQVSIVSDLLSRLMQDSLSDRELVLRLPEALAALEALATAQVPVLGWEGWIRYPDGRVGHSRQYQGTVSIDRDPGEAMTDYIQRSVSFTRTTIIADQDAWDREPEVPNGELYFCITPADA